MATADDIEKGLLPLSGKAREDYIFNLAANLRSVPDWLGKNPWKPITINETVAGVPHSLTIWVAPDFFTIGRTRAPMWPSTAQAVADAWHSILPSRKLSNDIYQAADVKLPFHPFSAADGGKANVTSARYIESSHYIDGQLLALGKSADTSLIAGHKKDILVKPNDDGRHVTIYNPEPNGVGGVIQPYSPLAHGNEYVDYSHGVRLIFNRALLDGKYVDLTSVFIGPLNKLVSDQGPFYPRIPNISTPTTPPSGIAASKPPVSGGVSTGNSVSSSNSPSLVVPVLAGLGALGLLSVLLKD
jgi:hypothetical protein